MSGVGKIGLGGKEAAVGKSNNHKSGYWGKRGDNNDGCMSYIIIAIIIIGLIIVMTFL